MDHRIGFSFLTGAALLFFAAGGQLAGGCHAGDVEANSDGSSTSSTGSGGAGGEAGSTSSSSATAATGTGSPHEPLTCAAPLDGGAPWACCADDKLRLAPTTAASVLDLSNPAAIVEGTCGTFVSGYPPTAVLLSRSPADYPMRVVLPALTGADTACLDTCPNTAPDGARTAFVIAITTGSNEVGRVIGGDTGRVLAISVPPPWFFVSGGCGESCAWPCLEGYQEFGVRSCVTMYYGDFGFATADPHAPSVEAVLELIDVEGEPASSYAPGSCCLNGTVP